MSSIPYQLINWQALPKKSLPGETGSSSSSIIQIDGLRIRMVEYSPGYIADHWCRKGHIVHCLEGEVISELETGESFSLIPGMMYIVSDELSSHRSRSRDGVKLLIIDGDFLK